MAAYSAWMLLGPSGAYFTSPEVITTIVAPFVGIASLALTNWAGTETVLTPPQPHAEWAYNFLRINGFSLQVVFAWLGYGAVIVGMISHFINYQNAVGTLQGATTGLLYAFGANLVAISVGAVWWLINYFDSGSNLEDSQVLLANSIIIFFGWIKNMASTFAFIK